MVDYKYIKKIKIINKFIINIILLISTQTYSKTNIIKNICPENNEAYFSCLTKNQKIISICKSNNQWIQYFFGKPKKIEFIYPLQNTPANSDFFYTHYFRTSVDYIELRFSNNNTMYTLHDYQSYELNDKRKSVGITMTSNSGEISEIVCSKILSNKLNLLEKIIPCDTESALGSRNCKQ